ncbi:MAG: hypothetical protein A2096_16380 [Spirochaetes bacterium GWF1_41_5]|nr:MAG: hypothetical protein A2096_16380 [Spirochaetes bacterium GWF1_41_5]HBE01366.1 DNA-binding protein [Spirochaetia bacterium]
MKNKNDLVQEWIKKAEQDFRSAEILLNSGENDIPYASVCFHCQQSAEKYLKAYCVQLDIDFPKTHNLSDLLVIISKKDTSLLKFENKLETLTPYAVDIRYPDDEYSIPKDTAAEALQIANEIKELVLKNISENI